DPAPIRQRRARPALMIPVSPQDPFARLGLGRVVLDPPHELLRTVGVAQIYLGKLKTTVDEVGVSVHEPGDDHRAVPDYPGARPHLSRDARAVSHPRDLLARNRHRL